MHITTCRRPAPGRKLVAALLLPLLLVGSLAPGWAGPLDSPRDITLANALDPTEAPARTLAPGPTRRQAVGEPSARAADASREPAIALPPAEPAPLSDFERLVTAANGGSPVRRLGKHGQRPPVWRPPEFPARVPPNYVLQAGDEISLVLWGGIDADARLRVDRQGRIQLPRVGPLAAAGVAMGELDGLIRARLARVFKGFEMSVSLTDAGPISVQVAGFVEQPGLRVLPPLTTLSSALQALHGQTEAGSQRRVGLQRRGETIKTYDPYRLASEQGQRDDPLLQSGDTLYIHEAGTQVAVIGSVNRVAIYELLAGETVADLLRWAGGFTPVAERSRIGLQRISQRYDRGAAELLLPRDIDQALENGDILRVLAHTDLQAPSQLLSKRVRVDGEVLRPGDYLLPKDATLPDLIAAAGGFTEIAFPYGAELKRDSVRATQESNYTRALAELESEIDRFRLQRSAADASPTSLQAGQQLLDRLRRRPPDGRVVLDVEAAAAQLPPTLLENGDRLHVPPRNRSVGVFGSVYNAGSFEHRGERSLGDYLRRAGGATDGGNTASMFVVRANGSVLSASEQGGWRGSDKFSNAAALPGDTVFVPERLDRSTLTQATKDWTQILYQFGLGIAALLAIK